MVGFLRLERGKSVEKSIEHYANGPNVDTKVIAGSIKYFGGNVVGRSTHCSLVLLLKLEMRCQSEIAYFHNKFLVEEDVGQLQIPVNVLFGVEVLDSVADSVQEGLDFGGGHKLSSFQELIETFVLTEFKHQVNVFVILEIVVEAHNILVVEGFMIFYFVHQLL